MCAAHTHTHTQPAVGVVAYLCEIMCVLAFFTFLFCPLTKTRNKVIQVLGIFNIEGLGAKCWFYSVVHSCANHRVNTR